MKMLLRTALTTLAAAVAITGLAPAASADATFQGQDLSNPSTFQPGTRWRSPESQMACTAGWVMHDSDGTYMYSAGHCGPKGGSATLGHSTRSIGAIGISQNDDVYDNATSASYDISAIVLDGTVPYSDHVPGFGAPVSMMSRDDLETIRPDLCTLGQTTGLSCGAYLGFMGTGTTLNFRGSVDHGDSGGPVFAVTTDGKIHAVGTLIGYSKDDRDRVIVQHLASSVPDRMRLGAR